MDENAVTEPTAANQPANPYRHLPEPVRLEDTITSKDPDDAPDPYGPGNPERDFMLRYAG